MRIVRTVIKHSTRRVGLLTCVLTLRSLSFLCSLSSDDGRASYSDFERFGAWTKPAMKQFNDAPEVCGASIDHNWSA